MHKYAQYLKPCGNIGKCQQNMWTRKGLHLSLILALSATHMFPLDFKIRLLRFSQNWILSYPLIDRRTYWQDFKDVKKVVAKFSRLKWFLNYPNLMYNRSDLNIIDIKMPGWPTAVAKNLDLIKAAEFSTERRLKINFESMQSMQKIRQTVLWIDRSLKHYLQNNKKLNWWDLTIAPLDVFQTLKSKLAEPLLLALPQLHRPFMIKASVSAYELGAIQFEQQNNCTLKGSATIGNCRQMLNEKELNFSATKRRVLCSEKDFPETSSITLESIILNPNKLQCS